MGVSTEDPLCAPHSHTLHQNPSPRAPGCSRHPPLLTSCGHHHTASALPPCSPAHPPKGSPPAGLTPEGSYTPLRPSCSEPAAAPFSLPGKASILGPLFPRPAVPSPHHPTLNFVPTLPRLPSPSILTVGKWLLPSLCQVIITTPVRTADGGSWPIYNEDAEAEASWLAQDPTVRHRARVLGPPDLPHLWPLTSGTPSPPR